jgi:hypothetical protein
MVVQVLACEAKGGDRVGAEHGGREAERAEFICFDRGAHLLLVEEEGL